MMCIACPRYKNENARLVRAFSFFIVLERLKFKRSPDVVFRDDVAPMATSCPPTCPP